MAQLESVGIRLKFDDISSSTVTGIQCTYLEKFSHYNVLLLIDRAIRRNWVMLYWPVDKYRMTQ